MENQDGHNDGVHLPGAGYLVCRGLGDTVNLSDITWGEDGVGLWASSNRGLYRYEPSGAGGGSLQRFGLADGLPSTQCQGVAVDREWLCVATDRGLARRPLDDGDGGSPFHSVPAFEGMDVRTVVTSPHGVFAATGQGLARIDGRGVTWAPLDGLAYAEPQELAVDQAGVVWAATHAGVIAWDGADGVRQLDTRRGLFGDVTHAIMIDHERSIWIGSDFGAAKLVPGPFETYGAPEGAPNTLVRAVAEDEAGHLWIGTRGGVAKLVDGRFETVELPDVKDPRIYALAPDGGGMWIGSRSGLFYSRGAALTHLDAEDGLPSSYITGLALEPGAGLWISTDLGLAFLDTAGVLHAVEHPLLTDTYILSLHRDRQDRLWVGLQSGGVRMLQFSFDAAAPTIDRVKVWNADSGLSDMTIWSIDDGDRGEVWLGSNGEGAFKINRDESLERFGVAQGLANDFIWQVEIDRHGAVWFYSNRGLNQLEASGALHHYGLSDGLPDLEGMAHSALESRSGALWFGTARGVVRYDPTQDEVNDKPPSVRIVELRSQRYGALAPGAVVPPDAGLLTARFTALTFRDESATRFRYRLNGADVGWSAPISDRSLSFAGLPPGDYELIVEAANGDDLWTEEPARFAFRIKPQLWQTWPFRLLAVLGALGFGWLLLRWRTKALDAERRRLGEVVAARTLELKKQNRHLEEQIDQVALAEVERQRLEERLRQSEKMEAVGRLAGGVAHDFNNLLTTISGFGELLSDKLGKDHPLQRDVGEILSASQRAARLTQQLLAFGRKQVIAPKVWGLNALTTDIARMLDRLLGEQVELVLELDAVTDTVRCDRGQLEQLILNLAVNGRDAMPQGGRLTLRTRLEALLHHGFGHLGHDIPPGSYVVLEVIDSGTGIEPELLEHIFEPFFTTKETGRGTGLGLATVYGIVNQNEGYIDVDSRIGHGTRFIVRFPHVEAGPADGHTSGSMPLIHVGRQRHSVLVVEDE
ncbi:MAG: ATP-binding protein, partial [Acidobacteriota bacterium]